MGDNDNTHTPSGRTACPRSSLITASPWRTNERSWRGSAPRLGLLAAAVAIVQLVPELSIAGARHVLGIILALLAILTAGMGILRWEQVDRAMRRDLPLPRHPTPIYLGIGLILVGLLALGLIVVKAVAG